LWLPLFVLVLALVLALVLVLLAPLRAVVTVAECSMQSSDRRRAEIQGFVAERVKMECGYVK
jgi:hypothetical protein